MDYRKLLPIVLILISFYLTIASAKKSNKDKSSSGQEIDLNPKEGQTGGISGELQALKTSTNSNGTASVKKPKHRRTKKHHSRGSHNRRVEARSRTHAKKRTNPTEILTADDDLLPKSEKTKTRSGKNKNPSTRIKSSNRSRATRHLDNLEGEREFTNGHSSANHHHHHKHHRLGRRRLHHKKHSKKINTQQGGEKPSLESPTLQDTSKSAIAP